MDNEKSKISCKDYQIMMMGFIDGELDVKEDEQFRKHVYACNQCAEELTGFQKLTELTDSLKLKEPADYEWERIYNSIFFKIESRVGWLFAITGCVTVFAYLLYEICIDWEMAACLRIGIVMALVGFSLLMVSTVRHRKRIKKYERYEAVKR